MHILPRVPSKGQTRFLILGAISDLVPVSPGDDILIGHGAPGSTGESHKSSVPAYSGWNIDRPRAGKRLSRVHGIRDRQAQRGSVIM